MRSLFILLFLFSASFLSAQLDSDIEYVPENVFVNENKIYEEGIHTVMLTRGGSPSSLPYIYLGGNDRLTLRFDDFSKRQDDINYRIVHCESDWETSDVPWRYYARGIEEGYLNFYEYSRTLNQSYIHYKLEVPNDDIQITQSGNYMLYVYRNGQMNKPILSQRFYVTEEKVFIKMDIHPAFDPMYRNEKQELDFSILHEKYPIINPGQSIKIAILQNQRWDNAITGLKPIFVQGNELSYNYDGENAFWAGNEYRYFDIRNLNVRSENVEGILRRPDTVHIFLDKAKPKKFHNAFDATQNLYGGFNLGSNLSFDNANTDVDYALVYFYISSDYELANGNFYAFGALSNYVHDDRFKFTYNPTKKRYELRAYLKQGLYNWHYHFVKDGTDEGLLKKMEGNYAITNNQYTVLIYHRPFGQDFDRLIKVAVYTYPNSGNDNND